MKVSNRLKGIGEYYFSQKLREIDELNRQGAQVVNLGIGSPDQPPHPDVIRVLQEESAKANVHAYQSYKGSPVLRKAISAWYNQWYNVTLDPDSEILPLIGSKEGIMHLCMTYLNKGDEVLIPNPGYPTYSSAVRLAGGKCVEYELTEENNNVPDLRGWKKKDLKKVKLMFVNYPQMPTGQLASQAMFSDLVAFAKKHSILVIHDNPYSFILNEKPMSILQVPGAKEVAVELNSLSKSHNMAGWRVGMLCGAKEKIDEVIRFKSNMDSGMFLPAQLAAAKALTLGRDWHDAVNNLYRARREKVFALLDLLHCTYSKDQAGLFVWAKVPEREKGKSKKEKNPFGPGGVLSDWVLDQARVFITPGAIFGSGGNDFLRVSLCSPEEKITESIQRIHAAINNKDKDVQ